MSINTNNINCSKINIVNKIENAEKKIDIIWENFITNEISYGMNLMAEIFQDLDVIITEINNIDSNNIDSSNFFKNMNQLENAMSIPDYILIADLIKYEIKPMIILWKNTLNF